MEGGGGRVLLSMLSKNWLTFTFRHSADFQGLLCIGGSILALGVFELYNNSVTTSSNSRLPLAYCVKCPNPISLNSISRFCTIPEKKFTSLVRQNAGKKNRYRIFFAKLVSTLWRFYRSKLLCTDRFVTFQD